MRMPTEEELATQTKGKVVAIHGKPEAGKTVTAIDTSPEPILFVSTEQRPFALNLENITKVPIPANKSEGWKESWHAEVVKDWYSRGNRVIYPDYGENTVNDLRDFWVYCYTQCAKKEFKFKTIIYDTMSYWMNIIVMNQLHKEHYKEVQDKAKKAKEVLQISLSDEYAVGLRQYGALGNIGNSILSAIKPMSQFDVFVVIVFQHEKNPNFNQAYEEAAYIKGASFMKDFLGQFDIIGVVKERIVDGNKRYPPYISFNDQPRSMTKWCGRQRLDENGNSIKLEIMDFKKIFGY